MCVDCRLSTVVHRGSTRVRLTCLSSLVCVVFYIFTGSRAYFVPEVRLQSLSHHRGLTSCMWVRVRLCGIRVNFPCRRERAPPHRQPWRTRVLWTTPRNRPRRSVSGNSQRKSGENCLAGCRSSPKFPTYLTLSSLAPKVRLRLTKSSMAFLRSPPTVPCCKRMRSPLSLPTRLNDWWVLVFFFSAYFF